MCLQVPDTAGFQGSLSEVSRNYSGMAILICCIMGRDFMAFSLCKWTVFFLGALMNWFVLSKLRRHAVPAVCSIRVKKQDKGD